MAIQVEMWKPEIHEQFFKSNEFVRHLYNADEYVIGGRVVHIPQSGGPSGVEKNRESLPAVIKKRTDTDITYVLDEFTTNPVLIPNADMVELSYDKRASVIRENTGELMEFVGDDLIYSLFQNTPAGSKIATTGGSSGTTATGTAPGATGTRYVLHEADVLKARTFLNKQNVPKNNRFLMPSSDMLAQLMNDSNLKYAFQQVVDLPEGVIGKLYGFWILERSSTLRLASDQSIKAPTAANATGDDDCTLFWQQDALERALGDVTMYDDYGRPEYYGDVYSFLVRCGGRSRRSDNKGYGIIYGAAN